MKIAIFGGSFNPIHNGHVNMVNYLIEYLSFDKIIIVPLGIPSHKENILAAGHDRVEMCKLSFYDREEVEVNSIEIDDEKVSYTIDTLMKIKKLYPNSEIYEVIGEDSAYNFHHWKEYKKILDECQVLVFKRESQTEIDENKISMEMLENFKRFKFMRAPYFPFSSTTIREKLKNWDRTYEDKILKEMLPIKVLEYIKEKKLYIS